MLPSDAVIRCRYDSIFSAKKQFYDSATNSIAIRMPAPPGSLPFLLHGADGLVIGYKGKGMKK